MIQKVKYCLVKIPELFKLCYFSNVTPPKCIQVTPRNLQSEIGICGTIDCDYTLMLSYRALMGGNFE